MKYKVRLAPMAGITDWPFRVLCSQMGAELCYTEMISAMGFLHARDQNDFYHRMLVRSPHEAPLVAQLSGHDPTVIGKAVYQLTQMGLYAGININMGCPARIVVSSNEGCSLMRNPILASHIMAAAAKSTLLPVSIKIRLGWDNDNLNASEFVRIAEEEGMDEVIIHGRTRIQQFSGKADWEMIGSIKKNASLPIIANGDIFSAADAVTLLCTGQSDAIMIARGSLGNPWIFKQVQAKMKGHTEHTPSPYEIYQTAVKHAEMMCSWKSEHRAIIEMRKHFYWYTRGNPRKSFINQLINKAKTIEEIKDALSVIHKGE